MQDTANYLIICTKHREATREMQGNKLTNNTNYHFTSLPALALICVLTELTKFGFCHHKTSLPNVHEMLKKKKTDLLLFKQKAILSALTYNMRPVQL